MSLGTLSSSYVPKHAVLYLCPSARYPLVMSLSTLSSSYVPKHAVL